MPGFSRKEITMDLTGKKINFLGDSITEGYCARDLQSGYVDLMKAKYALAEARNYGIAGTRIARQHTPSEESRFDLDFCSRVEEMDADADIVVVLGGTNDHGHGDAPLGRCTDRTPDTFHGACHVLFARLKKRFPGSAIVIATPMHRTDEDTPKPGSGAVLKDYVSILRDTAKQYGLPVLDLFETSAIQAHIPERAAAYTTDGLHPNDLGHAVLAQEIGSFLQKL